MIKYQKEKMVALITIDTRGEDIDNAFIAELNEICHDIGIDDDVRVTVIIGSGSVFATGLAIRSISDAEHEAWNMPASVSTCIEQLRCPTIAAINGDAFGQGFELALACDLRIAAEKARFSLPHILQGLIPWDGGTQRLTRITGITRSMEMVLTGKTIDAEEALSTGIVNQVVPAAELKEHVMKMAADIAAQSPLALSFAKEAVIKGLDLTLEQGLELECDLYMLLHTTGDRTEGIKAFLEKRPPDFKGE